MEKIMHIGGLVSEELHSDFRWALNLKGETAKDVIAQFAQDYVQRVKSQIARSSKRAR